jgi:endogenous inhibitor of DNA gyrase (YacG/DUF329 family)
VVATATRRRCERCSKTLDVGSRSDARYCSGRCRVAALRARKKTAHEAELRAKYPPHGRRKGAKKRKATKRRVTPEQFAERESHRCPTCGGSGWVKG